MRKKILPFVIASCSAVASFGQAVYCDKVIGGYVANWEDATNVNYNQLTHAFYAFIGSDAMGNLCTYEGNGTANATVMPKLEDRPAILATWNKFLDGCNAAKTKKIISIGGYGCDIHMNGMGASSTATANFVTQLMAFVDKYSLQGVDLDWEDVAPEHTANYRNVYNALRTACTAKGKLLICTVVTGYRAPNFPHNEMKSADFVQLMAYDQTATWPASPAGNHSTIAHANEGITKWAGFGIVKSKLVLGLPFYGYQQRNSVDGSTNGAKTKDWTYKAFVAAYPSLGDVDNHNLGTETIGLNGQTTIKAKTAIGYTDLKGVMVWEMTNDLPYTNAKSLHLAIIQKMKELCPSGTGNTTSIHDITGPVAISYYSSESSQVRVSIAKQGRVKVSLTTLLGQEVLARDLGSVSAGDYGVAIDKTVFKSGVYIVTVSVDEQQVNSKIYIE